MPAFSQKLIFLLIITAVSTANATSSANPTSSTSPTNQTSPARALTLQVKINGVAENLEKILLPELTIYQAIGEHKLVASRVRNLHEHAQIQLLDALEALGYYHAQVNSKLLEKNNNWQASYDVTLGSPTKINSITLTLLDPAVDNMDLSKQLTGKKNPLRLEQAKLMTLGKLKANNIITHQDYENTKEMLITIAQNFGYLGAKFADSRLNINRDNYQADVELVLATGEQYYFSTVSFHDTKYGNELLQRFVPFRAGDPYNLTKINLLHKNLADVDMFNKIRIDPVPDLTDPTNDQVPIEVRLNDKPLDRYTGSIGYGTDTSFRGSLGWQHRRVSHAGHKFSTGVNASGIRKQIFANYMIPGRQPGTDKYLLGSSITEETVKKKFSRKGEVSVSKLKKVNNIQTNWTLQYLTENFKVVENTELQRKKYLLPTYKWIWTKAAQDAELEHGAKIEFTARGGLDLVLSSTNLAQVESGIRWITPLTGSTRLLTRANVGYSAAKAFDKVPFSLRFFAGGDKSVRGFGYHSLGPKEIDVGGTENVVGGKNLLEGSIELDQPLYQQLSGAIFLDAGNAMNDWDLDLPMGAGVGLRWKTAIGSFRIDLARQVAKIESKNLRLHLTFGTDL